MADNILSIFAPTGCIVTSMVGLSAVVNRGDEIMKLRSHRLESWIARLEKDSDLLDIEAKPWSDLRMDEKLRLLKVSAELTSDQAVAATQLHEAALARYEAGAGHRTDVNETRIPALAATLDRERQKTAELTKALDLAECLEKIKSKKESLRRQLEILIDFSKALTVVSPLKAQFSPACIVSGFYPEGTLLGTLK